MRFLIFSVFFFYGILFSQTCNYKGQVINATTKSPLSGANVFLVGTVMGTSTDRDGYFKFTGLPAGEYQIEISYIGFSSVIKTITLSATPITEIFSLDNRILEGPVVGIEANRARQGETPVTFSNLDKSSLQARYITQDIPELISDLPSTTFYSDGGNGIGYNYLSIRGFDQRRISVLINGIPQNDPEDHNIYWIDFPDLSANVQNIQVQRGAGSAFYGPAAIGGSVNIQTDYFSADRQMRLFSGLGSYKTRKYLASYNSGLINKKYVFYGRLSSISSDGYRERSWVDYKSFFLGGAWYTPSHNLRLHFYGGPIKDGLVYNGLPEFINSDRELRRKNYSYWEADSGKITYAANRRPSEQEWFHQPHLEILSELRPAEGILVSNALFWSKGYGYFDFNGSWVNYYDSPSLYFRLTPEFGFDSSLVIPNDALIRAYVDNNQFGWLPQVTIQSEKGDLILGAELRHHQSLHWGRLQKGTGLPVSVTGQGGRHYYEYQGGKDIASVYFHQIYHIYKHFTLLSDVQYTHKVYHFKKEKFIGTSFDIAYNFLNPRLGISYTPFESSVFYLNVSHTSREPRLKNLYDAAEASSPESWNNNAVPQFEVKNNGQFDFTRPLVKPEQISGFETGYLYNTYPVQFSVNFYSMNFLNEIIKSGQLDRFGQPVTGNAKESRHQGIELSTTWNFLPGWSLSGNTTFSKNELLNYSVFEAGDNTSFEIPLDGNPIAGFPDFLANLRLSYGWNDFYASADGRFIGPFYTTNFKNEAYKTDGFFVMNITTKYPLKLISARLDRFEAQLRINNLFDNLYMQHGEGDEFFPGATRNWFFGLEYTLK